MQIFEWQKCSEQQQQALLRRPAVGAAAEVEETVNGIVEAVQYDGDAALIRYTEQLDRVKLHNLRLSAEEIAAAQKRLSDDVKAAIQQAVANITAFHQAQLPTVLTVETMPGVVCRLETRPIEAVGLYIPGGSAPLFSTVLMLAIPAKLAGCTRIVLCSPPPMADEIVYAAHVCGVREIYTVGGAQAIAAMAFGTESIAKVDKIFGPGNAWVTEAKRQVSQSLNGAAIDMPAGPSEVLVIADEGAEAAFIAADLLSQAEHGPDSQVILLTPARELAVRVAAEVDKQVKLLPRAAIAMKSLQQSRLIVTHDIEESIAISNRYGPEHLILQTRSPEELVPLISSAGSVFVGDWSPEAVGDYASGTNHVLPTYGYTKTYSSLGLADFQKRMTVQTLSKEGLLALGPTVATLAHAEHLDAHRLAVQLRMEKANG